jgi:uncharacterized membrane-anchored protein
LDHQGGSNHFRHLLTKPFAHGRLNLGRISSSLVIAIFMLGCILFTFQKAGSHPGSDPAVQAQ